MKALIKACDGRDFRERRDEALVRFMAETGTRAGETAALTLDAVDLAAGRATIERGKGGRGRVVPVGPRTIRALDRYLRLRDKHRLAGSPAFWLGDRGKGFSYPGLYRGIEASRGTGRS
ncbi:tyrosine-type recombinase/integrase [Fodinicola feengrottensis]|uniref:tyrosine-type recombinase/integrase n=1 Tax=Fodinicola feengrottensis TaxID=435914 RepID=UPI0024423797|nr:tyrosine-type recombinase/integrase [Fodinicola feengrottensis]